MCNTSEHVRRRLCLACLNMTTVTSSLLHTSAQYLLTKKGLLSKSKTWFFSGCLNDYKGSTAKCQHIK